LAASPTRWMRRWKPIGLSIQATDLAPKRLELFQEIVPGLNHLAIMANPASPNAALEISELRSSAATLGVKTAVLRSTALLLRRRHRCAAYSSLGGLALRL
jgi:hypothetical protein